jgi:type IV pilus assembly protein PilC
LLIKRQKDAYLHSILQNIRDRVKSGESLSEAFSTQRAFPKIYTTTLLAGERSGNMEEVLGRYIAFQRMALTFKKKLAVSLVYPALLVSVVFIMMIFLVTYVVPQFAKLYQDMGADLPSITQVMLSIGLATQKYALYIAVGIVLLIVGLIRWKNTDRGASAIDGTILKLPMLGDIWLKYQVSNFSRMLSTLLTGGMPLVPSLETAGASMSSRRILNGIAEAAVRVREGQPLAKALEAQRMFPDLSVEMIEVGESTGALPAMLNSVAEFYEEDVQTALGAAMSLIEPLILVVMAVVVGGILISLYLPIFTLGSHIH